MKLLRRLFQIVVVFIIFAVASAWLQDHNYTWSQVGHYVMRQSLTLAQAVGQDVLQIDWTFR